jgi:hypothetical protein
MARPDFDGRMLEQYLGHHDRLSFPELRMLAGITAQRHYIGLGFDTVQQDCSV